MNTPKQPLCVFLGGDPADPQRWRKRASGTDSDTTLSGSCRRIHQLRGVLDQARREEANLVRSGGVTPAAERLRRFILSMESELLALYRKRACALRLFFQRFGHAN